MATAQVAEGRTGLALQVVGWRVPAPYTFSGGCKSCPGLGLREPCMAAVVHCGQCAVLVLTVPPTMHRAN